MKRKMACFPVQTPTLATSSKTFLKLFVLYSFFTSTKDSPFLYPRVNWTKKTDLERKNFVISFSIHLTKRYSNYKPKFWFGAIIENKKKHKIRVPFFWLLSLDYCNFVFLCGLCSFDAEKSCPLSRNTSIIYKQEFMASRREQ